MSFTKIESGYTIEPRGQTPGWIHQVHGIRTVALESPPDPNHPPEADGVVTDRRGQRLHVVTADCLPVLIHDPLSGRIAAIHAGWRGARDGIVAAAIKDFFPTPNRLEVRLGPCLLSCCFEVREDFIQSFTERDRPTAPYLREENRVRRFDLIRFVCEEELSPVPTSQIDLSMVRCTYCSEPKLPSYRRNGNTDIRLLTWIRRVP